MTIFLIALNVLVFVVFQSELVLKLGRSAMAALAIVPGELIGPGDSTHTQFLRFTFDVPEFATPVTYMFLHGGWMHLIGNMLFLWVFGDNVEDAMGHFKFLVFFLLCGALAGYTHAFIRSSSTIPLIGASGGVAGVIGAYLMLHPNVMVWVLALGRIPVRLRAFWLLGAWILFQVGNVIVAGTQGVAWWAHIGGIVAGILLILVFKRPEVPLFDRSPLDQVSR